MYFSILTIVIIGFFVSYYLWQSKRNSDNDLNIINIILAVSYIEQNFQTHNTNKKFGEQKHKYSFLLQYFLDMHNLKVNELNKKWLSVYNFFHTRTSILGSGMHIKYTKYGRIHPDVIIHIAEMYKTNANVIGEGLWKETIECFSLIGKEYLNKGDFHYPKDFEELLEAIDTYDKYYIGDISMEKRQTS